jgi:hypothetical protein
MGLELENASAFSFAQDTSKTTFRYAPFAP